jgi:putative N-acetylmannosamine-6-phosphate epimerase
MSSLCQLTFAIAFAVITSPLVGITQETATVQGEWILNRDLTPAIPKRDDDMRRPEGQRRRPSAALAAAAAFPLVAAALVVGSAMTRPEAGVDRAKKKFAS